MYKNVSGQKVAVYAYDKTTGAPKTGDAANITAYIAIDGGTPAATNDTNPTELDATNMKGWYLFDLTQAETNGNLILISPVSGTANILIDPVDVFTKEVMRGTDSAALASVCTETRLSELDAGTSGKMANQVDEIRTDTEDIQTQIGTDGDGLTSIPWNAAWDTEVESECTDALNAYDPPTKAELDAAVADVSVDEIQASALADLFNTDSGTTYGSSVSGSVVKEIADNAGGSSLTAEDIRIEIDSNSTQLAAIVADTNELQSDLTNGGRLDLILDELTSQGDTNEGKIDIAQADLDIITGADGVTLATSQGNYAPAIAGDEMDFVDAPNSTAITAIQNGLATSAEISGVDGKIDTVDSNVDTIVAKLPTNYIMGSSDQADHDGDFVSSARQGYLDNLNISENVAGTSEVTAVLADPKHKFDGPRDMDRPISGSITGRFYLTLFDSNGNMEAPDAAPTVSAENESGTTRSANLDSTTMTLVSTGKYRCDYTVANTHASERITLHVTYVEGGNSRTLSHALTIFDSKEEQINALYDLFMSSHSELAGVPAAAAGLSDKIEFLFMALRNKFTSTATQQDIHNDAGSSIASASLSDDGTTLTKDKFS